MIHDLRAVTGVTDSAAAGARLAKAATATKVVGSLVELRPLVTTDHAEPRPQSPALDGHAKYAAVIAALIDVRPDIATGRFDDELNRAVREGRIDSPTARTLRWWQRTSVRAAESYATALLPEVLAARDRAEAAARDDAGEAAAAWQAARDVAAVRELKPARVGRLATARAAADHAHAIRAAFAESAADLEPTAPICPTDLVATTVEHQRKDANHAHSSTPA